jgi:hypothetical protein
MSQIDFTLQGLNAEWPSQRWLDFLDGPSAGPPVGVWLGNSGETASLYLATYPQARFDEYAVRPGDDPLKEMAHAVTFMQINRILFQLRLREDWCASLLGPLKQYAESRAEGYLAWRTVRWQATSSEDQVGEELQVASTTLAGWESGFGVTSHSYVAAHAYGMTLDNLRIAPVPDSSVYGFTLENAQMRRTAMTFIPGTDAPAELSQDLADLLRT